MWEMLLRRDGLVFAGGLLLVAGLSWVWLLMGAGMPMMSEGMAGGAHGRMMQPAVWSPGYAMLMFSMWWVMMVAMMLPSAAPVLLIYMRIARKSQEKADALAPAAVFAAGYLVAWGGFSVVATGAQWGLEASGLLSPMLKTSSTWLAAAILIAAGLWQLTPLKAVCLRYCRTPMGFLMGNWRTGVPGVFIMGLEHGAYCLGCCWFLMALLFVGGVMNFYWIAGLALYVLLEKTMPYGHWLGHAAGIGLIGWGAALVLV